MSTGISAFAWPSPSNNTAVPSPQHIIDVVCKYYNIDLYILYLRTRKTEVVRLRYMCWHLIKLFNGKKISLKIMGGLFGVYNNYDHTTLIHGLQTFSNDLEHEDELKKHVEAIMTRITETNE